MSGWYYAKNGLLKTEDIGPLPDFVVLKMARDGELTAGTMVRHEVHTQNQWVPLEMIPAAKVKLDEGSAERQVARIEKAKSVSAATVDVTKKASVATAKAIGGAISSFVRKKELPRENEVIHVESRPLLPFVSHENYLPQEYSATTIPCKFCHEPIIATAMKCKHCGEFTDPRFAPQKQAPAPIIINNSNDNYVSQRTSVSAKASAKSQSTSSSGGCVQTALGLLLLIFFLVAAIICAGVTYQP